MPVYLVRMEATAQTITLPTVVAVQKDGMGSTVTTVSMIDWSCNDVL